MIEIEEYVKIALQFGINEYELSAEQFPTRIVSPNQRNGVVGIHSCIELATASRPLDGKVIRVALHIQQDTEFKGMPSAAAFVGSAVV